MLCTFVLYIRPQPMRLPFLLFFSFFFLLSPKHALAQVGATTLETTLKDAEAAYKRGRPDYILARKAVELAEGSKDLRLKARAYLLQARLDSTGRRYSRALPNYLLASSLQAQADEADASAALAAAQAKAKAAQEAEADALEAKKKSEEELEETIAASKWKYIAVIGICLAILAAGALGFLATVKKLRDDVLEAKNAQASSDEGFEKIKTQLTESSFTSLKQLRRIFQNLASRVTSDNPSGALKMIEVQNAALGYLAQSSFDKGKTHEVAMEAFFAKYNPDLNAMLNTKGAHLDGKSMPLRLPIDQAVPVALIYTELVSNAFKFGGGEVQTSLTKEGANVSMLVKDNGPGGIESATKGEGLNPGSGNLYTIRCTTGPIAYLSFAQTYITIWSCFRKNCRFIHEALIFF